MKIKPTITERGVYTSHKQQYWQFSNTDNRREVVRRYYKTQYTEEEAKRTFINCIYSYPSE